MDPPESITPMPDFAPEINPAELYGRKLLRGDVDVVEELSEGGSYELKYYHVRSITESAG